MRQLGVERQLFAPPAVAQCLLLLRQATGHRQQQAQGVVGHTVVVGACAIDHRDAMLLGMRHGDVLVAGPERRHQPQGGQGVDLRGAQAGAAVGQDHLGVRRALGDGVCMLLGVRGHGQRQTEGLAGGGQRGLAGIGQVDQGKQLRGHA